jgi:hypothetical protein
VISVPLHFTIFTTNLTTAQLINHTHLEEQVSTTNAAFAPLQINFFISSISYHIGEEWRRFTQHKFLTSTPDFDAYANAIKSQNRYGGNDEANIWIVESMDGNNVCQEVEIAGYCSLSRYLTEKDHYVDGCVLTTDTISNVKFRQDSPGDGKTLTHELGHWFDF